MEDVSAASEDGQQVFLMPDVDDVERRSRMDVLALAGGEVVDDVDVIALFYKSFDQVAADEAGAAGDDYLVGFFACFPCFASTGLFHDLIVSLLTGLLRL